MRPSRTQTRVGGPWTTAPQQAREPRTPEDDLIERQERVIAQQWEQITDLQLQIQELQDARRQKLASTGWVTGAVEDFLRTAPVPTFDGDDDSVW